MINREAFCAHVVAYADDFVILTVDTRPNPTTGKVLGEDDDERRPGIAR